MNKYIEFLNQFTEKSEKFYWINVMVKQKEISECLAGHLIVYFNL